MTMNHEIIIKSAIFSKNTHLAQVFGLKNVIFS